MMSSTIKRYPSYTLCLSLVLGLIFCSNASAEIYTWTDDQGQTVYSDRPAKQSKKIEPPPVITVPGLNATTEPPATTVSRPTAISYRNLAIIKPVNDEAQWLPTGTIDVVIDLDPALAVSFGHYLSIKLDGQDVVTHLEQNQTQLSNIFRGSHTLTVSVHDQSGATLKQSPAITFHVHRR